jgi:hypothetical protein
VADKKLITPDAASATMTGAFYVLAEGEKRMNGNTSVLMIGVFLGLNLGVGLVALSFIAGDLAGAVRRLVARLRPVAGRWQRWPVR